MGSSKLRAVHVIIIGCVVCALVVVGLYFAVIKKSYERIATMNTQFEQYQNTANQIASVQAKLDETKRRYSSMLAQYEKYMNKYMPPVSFENRAQGMIALWKEQTETLGPLLQRWPRKTGVRLTSSVQVPAPPVNPNAIDTTLITIPIGTFNVTGDFSAILGHIRSWRNFNRLVKIDPVSLTGPSPGMSASYALTVYIFPRGEAGPNVEMAGGGSAAAGVPGMPGAPGMPGPGMPGPSAPGAMPSPPGAPGAPPL